ncbi:MAG: hypothetical protein ACTSRP_11345 [Candidatus Helarchaeota archaeon]
MPFFKKSKSPVRIEKALEIKVLIPNNFIPQKTFIVDKRLNPSPHSQEVLLRFQNYILKMALISEDGSKISIRDAISLENLIIASKLLITNLGIDEEIQFEEGINAPKISKEGSKYIQKDGNTGDLIFIKPNGKPLQQGGIIAGNAYVLTIESFLNISKKIEDLRNLLIVQRENFEKAKEELINRKNLEIEQIKSATESRIKLLEKELENKMIELYKLRFGNNNEKLNTIYEGIKSNYKNKKNE